MSDNMRVLRDRLRRLETATRWVTQRQFPQATLFWVLASAIPVLTIVSTHLWLRSAYTGGVFHLQGFLDQYDSGIYRYRLLGRDAVLFVYQQLLHAFRDQPLMMPRDPNATLLFYASYVVINALCFTVSNFLLLLLLSDDKRRISDLHLATYLYLTLIQTFAMAVVTPYDQLAYLLILISLFAAMISKNWIAYAALGLAAIAGGLTRETQFLVTPALFTVALFSTAKRSKRFWTAGFCNLAFFGLVYIALRAFLPGPKIIAAGISYGGKSALVSFLAVALVFYISTSLAVRIHSDVRPTITLLIFSAPYIVSILVSGAIRELRLLVPLLLSQTFAYLELASHSGQEAESTPMYRSAGLNPENVE